ncbi:hypothetical protein CF326_g6854 [Tilletia indica]|uniref:Uncharacterized protein n=1 Tax=Tilletia indica TaxID=43049 RepID=A0A177TZ23_9BASI|nr:hypothetical protein CF326_g6854 [Tilletia indica]KAE8260044.1 hypothetical protein A4X13_0g612 [Tilletia indica]
MSSQANIFDPAALIQTLQSLLPTTESAASNQEETATSNTQLANPYDAIAALSHTFMTLVGFRLVGLGEDHRLESSSAGAAAGEGSGSGESGVSGTNRLPKEWNARGPESYAFRYRHNQSAMEFVLKIVRMSGRALIHALAVEDNKTATLDVSVADYTSAAFFPYPPGSASDSGSTEPLINGFIGSARLRDLSSLFKINIIQKLVPGLQKEGYLEESGPATAGSSSQADRNEDQQRRREPGPDYDPLLDPRFQPRPARPGQDPHFDPFAGGGHFGGRNPATIGDRDLNPLGIPPGIFGGGPPPLFGGGDNGGGMIVGPNHPMFRDRFGSDVGGTGGEGGLPVGAVPPGARFDPIGPFGGPMGPGRGGPGGGPRRPGRGGPLGGDPDWDDLAPPRNSDYDNMFM